MNTVAMVLVRDTPDLVEAMLSHIPAIVVDNGSVVPLARGNIRIQRNRYFAGGWNAAMNIAAECGHEWAWMLNSDVDGVSLAMLDALACEAAASGVVAISPIIEPCKHRHMQQATPSAKWIDWVAPVVNVQWFRNSGGFDEHLPGWGADIDLCFRAEGIKAVSGNHRIRHAWGVTAKRLNDTAMYRLAESREYLLAKHGPAIMDFAPEFWRDD
jgi:GT2 family glycosyltransferase